MSPGALRRAACFGALGLLLVAQLTTGGRGLVVAAGVALAVPAFAAALAERRRGEPMSGDIALGVGVLMTVPLAAGLLDGPAGWAVGLAGLAVAVHGLRSAEQ
jgi:hypothetical protein